MPDAFIEKGQSTCFYLIDLEAVPELETDGEPLLSLLRPCGSEVLFAILAETLQDELVVVSTCRQVGITRFERIILCLDAMRPASKGQTLSCILAGREDAWLTTLGQKVLETNVLKTRLITAVPAKAENPVRRENHHVFLESERPGGFYKMLLHSLKLHELEELQVLQADAEVGHLLKVVAECNPSFGWHGLIKTGEPGRFSFVGKQVQETIKNHAEAQRALATACEAADVALGT